MLDLIAASIKGRMGKNSIIILALLIATSALYIILNFSQSMGQAIEMNSSRMGADLAILPMGAKEGGLEQATQGPPQEGRIPLKALQEIQRIAGVEAISPQVYLGNYTMGDQKATLLGYDPQTDFTVKSWLINPLQGNQEQDQVIIGKNLINLTGSPLKVGDKLTLGEQSYRVAGIMDESGSYLDTSVFKPYTKEEISKGYSWMSVKTQRDVPLDQYANILQTNVAQIEVITRTEMSNTLSSQLTGILKGKSLLYAGIFILAAMMLILGSMFNLSVHEQKRDLGLFQAMGATKRQISKLIYGEAFILALMGALLGLVLGILAFYFVVRFMNAPGFVFQAPPFTYELVVAMSGILCALIMGGMAAVFPLWQILKLDPYDAIRQGE